MAPTAPFLSPESLLASGLDSSRLSLAALQSKMKCDPDGYESELLLLYRRFDSTLDLFRHQAASNPSSDPAIAKELADVAMFLAHVTPFYPNRLQGFPWKVAELLRSDGRSLPASLRGHLAKALVLLINKKMISIEDTLELFMDLQILGDKNLRDVAFKHVIHTIRRMNQKHKDESKNRKLQNILFSILQEEDELRAKRSLAVLCDLHRRKVWFDDRTANAICMACFHASSRVMISTLSFLLGYERIEEQDDSEGSGSEDDTSAKPQIFMDRQEIYKAHHKGTSASKKKKKAKLQRAARSMKKQQRISSENSTSTSYSPLTHLKDAQGFAEKLFSCLQKSKSNERFEVKMMILKVIARAIGMHRLVLLNFYPFIQKYAQPHQLDVTNMLAAAVQACHDMVPPNAVEPLFKQIVNQFIHDRCQTEAIAVGLNVVREICMRMPLLMNEDLLQDLVLYKKSHEKAVSTAARSLITLFREICPSLLVKKDRGRPVDPKAKPKAFGEVTVASNVPGVELLEDSDNEDSVSFSADGSQENETEEENDDVVADENVSDQIKDEDMEVVIGNDDGEDDGKDNIEDGLTDENVSDWVEDEDIEDLSGNDDDLDDDVGDKDSGKDEDDNYDIDIHRTETETDCNTIDAAAISDDERDEIVEESEKNETRKRNFLEYNGSLDASNASLRMLKRVAADGIYSNEDFQRIKELRAKKEMKAALSRHGILPKGVDPKQASFKVPSSEHLSTMRVDPAKLEINIKRKFTKEERLALVKAGREDRGKYQARAAVKQKKTGGSTNKQKEHKKVVPFAAKKAKMARNRQEKKKQRSRSQKKQFRGKKAWK